MLNFYFIKRAWRTFNARAVITSACDDDIQSESATSGVSCQLEQDVIAHALSVTVTTYEKEARRQAEAANWSLLR